jgi:hypothetical protein
LKTAFAFSQEECLLFKQDETRFESFLHYDESLRSFLIADESNDLDMVIMSGGMHFYVRKISLKNGLLIDSQYVIRGSDTTIYRNQYTNANLNLDSLHFLPGSYTLSCAKFCEVDGFGILYFSRKGETCYIQTIMGCLFSYIYKYPTFFSAYYQVMNFLKANKPDGQIPTKKKKKRRKRSDA